MSHPTTTARVWFAPEEEEDRFLPEGPRAVEIDGDPAVAWVNIQTAADAQAGSIWVKFLDEEDDQFYLSAPGRPGFLLPTTRPGTALVGLGKELRYCFLTEAEWYEPFASIDDANPRTIINDAEIVPGGRAVVFGTKDVKFADPLASLYLFTLDDKRITRLRDGQTCSNGKVFARNGDGIHLFDIDTPRKVVTRYRLDLAARVLVEEGTAVDLRGEAGFPDGMVDCGDGTVIVAFYNPEPVTAGRAVRYRLATGEAIEEWTTPGSPRVTCPLLVDQGDGVSLILSTAVEGMPSDQQAQCPNAGCLFIAETRFTSVPPPESLDLG